MIKLGFFIRTALHSLQRGGQRAWAALLCIAFGVMSLVAMTLLAQALDRALTLSPSEWMGADASLGRLADATILPGQIEQLQALQRQGALQVFSLAAVSSDLIIRTPESGNYHPVSNGLGIDPAVYPVAGSFTISRPVHTGLASLLRTVGDVVVTRDLAARYGLEVGDAIILSTLGTGAPVNGKVRGIASDTPNHLGSKVYYTLATADALARSTAAGGAANTVLVRSANLGPSIAELESSGWTVFTGDGLTEANRGSQSLYDLLFKGAGILGMMVGGIGIANTMQVLLSRRREEAAIWLALGYTSLDLHLLFTLEAAVLGLSGSLLGAGTGIWVAYQLVGIFSRTGNLLVDLAIAPSIGPVASSLAAGVLTAILFALWASVSASQVSPSSLLRGETSAGEGRAWWQKGLLSLGLALPFWALSSAILGSAWQGLGLLAFALGGLVVLGGVMAGATWAFARLLPTGLVPMLRLVQDSLRRHSRSLVFAMIALFTGVVTLTFGVVVAQNAERVITTVAPNPGQVNLAVIARGDQEEAVRQALATLTAQGVQGKGNVNMGYQITVGEIHPAGQADIRITPVIAGRGAQPFDYAIQGAPWGSLAEGVYTDQSLNLAQGSQIEVTLLDGSHRTFTVAGQFAINYSANVLPVYTGLLMPLELSRTVGAPDSLRIYAHTDGDPARAAAALGRLLTGDTVLDLNAYAARYSETYQNLFVLALAMAGLALLAGALLVANSVSLSLLERRYEFGVLKATGYSHRHVLGILAAEYGGVALVATSLGLAAVGTFLWILGKAQPAAGNLLLMSAPTAVQIGAGCIGLIVLTVLAVAWRTTLVSPIVILADRG